jgi:hypothetical protein
MMKLLVPALIATWLAWGSLKQDAAKQLWPDSAAPWETVDAIYYPSRNDLMVYRRMTDLASVDACRLWVRDIAASMGDPGISRGDYECGVGKLYAISNDLIVYRLTVR